MLPIMFVIIRHRSPRVHYSFPTRRSSDLRLPAESTATPCGESNWALIAGPPSPGKVGLPLTADPRSAPKDRKSTRLNSSHANISYAVFCLKKKKIHRLLYYLQCLC